MVNRDLSRRVRSVNGLTHHKPVVRNDIKLSARLVHALDQKGSLWGEEVRTPYHTPYHTLTVTERFSRDPILEKLKYMGGETDDLHMMEAGVKRRRDKGMMEKRW